MPACLLQILVDDSDIMTRQRMVSRLPARHTVDSIIDDVGSHLLMKSVHICQGYSPFVQRRRQFFNARGRASAANIGGRKF